jgi:hypothetical protein
VKELAVNVTIMLLIYVVYRFGFEVSAVYLAAMHAAWMLRGWNPGEGKFDKQIEQLEAMLQRVERLQAAQKFKEGKRTAQEPSLDELREQLMKEAKNDAER